MADNLPTFTGTEADILATKPASLELGRLQAHERFANLFWQLDKAGNMIYHGCPIDTHFDEVAQACVSWQDAPQGPTEIFQFAGGAGPTPPSSGPPG